MRATARRRPAISVGRQVIGVNDLPGGYEYPGVVRFEIEEQDLPSYQRAADFLNMSNADIVCVQHEFGIYGGPAGGHLLALLRALRMPVVTTLLTILREPNGEQRRVMQELIARSTRLVVMTGRGRQMLEEIYQAPADRIDLIPHGIPDMPFIDPNYYKDQFGLEGRLVLLTFGLLSPNKGIEHALNARAFILAVLLDAMEAEPQQVRTLATTYAAFLHHAFNPQTRRFHNHLSFDRRCAMKTVVSNQCSVIGDRALK